MPPAWCKKVEFILLTLYWAFGYFFLLNSDNICFCPAKIRADMIIRISICTILCTIRLESWEKFGRVVEGDRHFQVERTINESSRSVHWENRLISVCVCMSWSEVTWFERERKMGSNFEPVYLCSAAAAASLLKAGPNGSGGCAAGGIKILERTRQRVSMSLYEVCCAR